jgi:D-arabinose 5-phosphate isomerase GutQ
MLKRWLKIKGISLKMAKLSLKIESKAIADVAGYLDIEAFKKAVEAICACNKVITCASGTSGIAAKKFAHSLCCIERDAFFMSPAEAVHGGLGGLKKEDVMVMVSRGGKTNELLPIIDVCNKKKATLVGITENMSSPLADNADIVVPLKIEKESDKYNMMATASFVATIGLFDAILVAVMEETDYQKEQFRLIHPGGAVGSLLNSR